LLLSIIVAPVDQNNSTFYTYTHKNSRIKRFIGKPVYMPFKVTDDSIYDIVEIKKLT